MSETQAKYLDTFPTWLRSLGDDTEALGSLLDQPNLGSPARETIAGALNYLFKSLDLIPDGIDDIGYLDDAFVLRVAAELVSREDLSSLESEQRQVLDRLAGESETVREFLEDDYERLESYVKGLRKGAARGRAVSDIIDDESTRKALLEDVRGFARSYEPPGFEREEKNLIKLKAFFDAKLPK